MKKKSWFWKKILLKLVNYRWDWRRFIPFSILHLRIFSPCFRIISLRINLQIRLYDVAIALCWYMEYDGFCFVPDTLCSALYNRRFRLLEKNLFIYILLLAYSVVRYKECVQCIPDTKIELSIPATLSIHMIIFKKIRLCFSILWWSTGSELINTHLSWIRKITSQPYLRVTIEKCDIQANLSSPYLFASRFPVNIKVPMVSSIAEIIVICWNRTLRTWPHTARETAMRSITKMLRVHRYYVGSILPLDNQTDFILIWHMIPRAAQPVIYTAVADCIEPTSLLLVSCKHNKPDRADRTNFLKSIRVPRHSQEIKRCREHSSHVER